MCVWLFFNADIGERSCDSSPDTRFHSVVQACDFMCIWFCACDVDPDIHKGQNNVLF